MDERLQKVCKLLRYDILTSTTKAGSGHPSSSLSAVELMASLFFNGFFMQDTNNLHNYGNDRVIFSKGHAAPLLYALYHVAGVLSYQDLLILRTYESNLEGHPTPRLPFVDVATGSLGQGLSIGFGMAVAARRRYGNQKTENGREPKVFVLLGDSELAEGQNWEAAELASYYHASNLIAIVDVNRLGQRGETMLGWDLESYAKRFTAFGWNAVVVNDGHNLDEIQKTYSEVLNYSQNTNHSPSVIIARTVKGKGVSLLENADNWHGKTLDSEQLQAALSEQGEVDTELTIPLCKPELPQLNTQTHPDSSVQDTSDLNDVIQRLRYNYGGGKDKGNKDNTSKKNNERKDPADKDVSFPNYATGDRCSTRQAYGDALVSLASHYPNLMVLNAETSNSTMEQAFSKQFPDRFIEMFIAEQNMVSAAVGLNKCGYKTIVSSFGAFLTRAFDQMRMAQYSEADIKIVGSHVGVSIGADGSSQMALEDIAMIKSILKSIILYPSDAVSTVKLVEQMLDNTSITYLRLTREKTPVIYPANTSFPIGGSHVLRESTHDSAVIFSAGYTLHEGIKAYDLLQEKGVNTAVVDLYSVKPLDEKTIMRFAHNTPHIIIVEDHYLYGGIGDSIFAVLAKEQDKLEKMPKITHLAVKEIPHSGTPEELIRHNKLDAESIADAVINNIA